MLFRKKSLEPESETIKKIYNQLTEIQKSIEVLETRITQNKSNIQSLRSKIWREQESDPENQKEKPFIGMQPIYG
jgi:hypothetical protein